MKNISPKLILLLLGLTLLNACSTKRSNVKTIFDGEWKVVTNNTTLSFERNECTFIFTSDSFYIKKLISTDNLNPCDLRSEYFSGVFHYDKDSIYLAGSLTDANNEEAKINDCIKEIKFKWSYKYQLKKLLQRCLQSLPMMKLLPQSGRQRQIL